MIPTSFVLQSHSVRYLHNYTFIDCITVGTHYIKKKIFEYETINKTHNKLNKKLTMHVSLLSSIAHLHWNISYRETQMGHIAYRIRWFIFIYQQYPPSYLFHFLYIQASSFKQQTKPSPSYKQEKRQKKLSNTTNKTKHNKAWTCSSSQNKNIQIIRKQNAANVINLYA